MIYLKTERLTIRRIAADDWKSIQSIWADFNQSPMRFYDTPHDTEDEQVKRRVQKWLAFSGGLEHMFFAVCLESAVIGCVSFNIRKDGHEIGYCFHSAYHGKGYAKESMLALFDYVRSLGIKRLMAGTALKNMPSVALLKALGFKRTETEKVSFYKDENGNDIFFVGGVFEL
ncbi:MAG: GNAT family N-acetyltransferase, partial [Clostridia bacterium]|nr:GNAT family N-acetyltransferase [Clostridia bacterium]